MKKLTSLLLPLFLIAPQACSTEMTDNKKAKPSFSVAIETPSSCEKIQISEIYQNDESAVVVAKIFKPSKNAMCMMMMSSSKDSAILKKPLPKQTQVVIIGKSWCWKNQSESTGYQFIKTQNELDALIKDKNKTYSNPVPPSMYYQGFEAGKNCKS